jgi:hypothetical protein
MKIYDRTSDKITVDEVEWIVARPVGAAEDSGHLIAQGRIGSVLPNKFREPGELPIIRVNGRRSRRGSSKNRTYGSHPPSSLSV